MGLVGASENHLVSKKNGKPKKEYFLQNHIDITMDKTEIKALVNKEIEKTQKIIKEYEELVKPEAPDVAIGRVSRMDAINNRSVVEASLRQAREKLDKLNFVLTKVDKPDFGLCMRCGNPIPIGRIIIRPESVHCVNCAR